MHVNPRVSKPKRRNGNGRVASAAAAAVQSAAGPPMLIQTPRTADVMRFQANSAVGSTIDITWGCLRNLYFTTLTASTANTIFQAIRLIRLEVWAPPSGASTSAAFALPVTLRYREGDGMIGEDKVVSEVVTSTAGAYIHRKFSKTKTDTGKWHLCSEITNSDIAFSIINAPGGTVIDVTLGWSGWAAGSAVVGLTCAALTAGRIYRNSLDNTTNAGAIGGSVFLPIGTIGSTGVAFG